MFGRLGEAHANCVYRLYIYPLSPLRVKDLCEFLESPFILRSPSIRKTPDMLSFPHLCRCQLQQLFILRTYMWTLLSQRKLHPTSKAFGYGWRMNIFILEFGRMVLVYWTSCLGCSRANILYAKESMIALLFFFLKHGAHLQERCSLI